MQHIPKQSHYVRCPALEVSCSSLCGPQTKKFGEPWLRVLKTKLAHIYEVELRLITTGWIAYHGYYVWYVGTNASMNSFYFHWRLSLGR